MEKFCPYCNLTEIKKRTYLKNNFAFAFLTYQPITPGHTLISPLRCVPKFEDLTNEELAAIFNLKHKAKEALTKTFSAEGFNYAWNENEVSGQSVAHFHLHIVPRKKGDAGIYQYEPRKFLYRTEGRPITPEKELQEVVSLIKKNT